MFNLTMSLIYTVCIIETKSLRICLLSSHPGRCDLVEIYELQNCNTEKDGDLYI